MRLTAVERRKRSRLCHDATKGSTKACWAIRTSSSDADRLQSDLQGCRWRTQAQKVTRAHVAARLGRFARLRREHTYRQYIMQVETDASNMDRLPVPKPRRTSCMAALATGNSCTPQNTKSGLPSYIAWASTSLGHMRKDASLQSHGKLYFSHPWDDIEICVSTRSCRGRASVATRVATRVAEDLKNQIRL